MFLAVDIGNTNIKLALFRGKKISYNFRLATDNDGNVNQYLAKLTKLFRPLKVKSPDIEAILVCSVVPKLTPVLKKALFCLLNKKPLILGQDIHAPIKNLYKKPKQVGQDRLANAVAAVSEYGAPTIVVDFGTALTFDVVSAKGNYLGGIIVPGMEVSLKALIRNAALLPNIRLARPSTFLGRETVCSMRSGLVYGYSFLVEGILQQLKKKLRQNPQVIATGGTVGLMFRYCSSINKINANLTLEGLQIIYQRSKKRRK